MYGTTVPLERAPVNYESPDWHYWYDYFYSKGTQAAQDREDFLYHLPDLEEHVLDRVTSSFPYRAAKKLLPRITSSAENLLGKAGIKKAYKYFRAPYYNDVRARVRHDRRAEKFASRLMSLLSGQRHYNDRTVRGKRPSVAYKYGKTKGNRKSRSTYRKKTKKWVPYWLWKKRQKKKGRKRWY